MSMFFNIGSLVLGFAAWVLPWIPRKRPVAGFSFVLCALALLLQILEIRNRVQLGDFSAIEDTIGAVAFAAVVLVTVTAVLNAAAYIRNRRNRT